jgi:MFS family permease
VVLDKAQPKNPFRNDLLKAGRPAGLTFILLMIICLFVFCQQTLDAPNLTQIGTSFGLTGSGIDEVIGGKSFMWQMIVISVSLILFGYLSDMTNRKILLGISLLLAGISYLLASFAKSPGQFIILRSLGGIGIGGFVPVMFSIIGDMFSSKSRAAASGIFVAIVNIGYGNGFILGGAIGSETAFGWRASFQVQSIILILLTGLFIIAGKLPERGLADTRDTIGEGITEYKGRIKLSDLKTIFSIPTNLIFIISCIIATMPMGYVQRFMVDYYSKDIGLGTGTATMILLIVLSGSLIGDLIGGFFGDMLHSINSRYPAYLSALALFAGCILFLVFFAFDMPRNAGALLLAIPIAIGFVASSFVEIPTPVSKAIMLDVNLPENRGTISALIQITAQIGFGLGALIGVFGDDLAIILGLNPTRLFNFRLAMLILIPVGLSWMLVAYTIKRDEKKAKEMMLRRMAQERQN